MISRPRTAAWRHRRQALLVGGSAAPRRRAGCEAIIAAAATLAAAAAALLCWPAPSGAVTTAALSASFHPYRLGGRSTLQFGFELRAESGQIPPPLTEVELRYPADIGVYNSELGLASCTAGALESGGPGACPADSVMGYGVVHTGVRLGSTTVDESSLITVFRAPYEGRHLALLFFAEGREPVLTDVIFPGLLLPAPEPFGGRVSIGVPLVETLPGAPYVSVLRLHATLGPENVTYFKRAGGITFAFQPRGIELPRRCPRAGFPFAASFTFSGGTRALAHTTVQCREGQAEGGAERGRGRAGPGRSRAGRARSPAGRGRSR